MGKMIAGTVVVLIVLLIAFFMTREGPFTDPSAGESSTSGLEAFTERDFSAKAAKIVIQKGSGEPVELEKKGSDWVVASAWGYEADPEAVQKLLADLDSLEGGEILGKSSASHSDFEVDKLKGGFVTVKDESGADLGRLVVGKGDSRSRNFTGKSKVFVRFGDDVETYSVTSDVRSNAKLWSDELEAKAFLKKKLIDTKQRIEKGEEKKVETEIFEVRISRPGEDDLLAELRREEVPVEEKDDAAEESPAATDAEDPESAEDKPDEEQETKTEEYFVVTSGAETFRVGTDKEWSARSLLNKGETVRIDDVAEPKPLAEYGLDEPQLKVTYKYRGKDVEDAPIESVTLLFGNAIKDEKGEDKEYYFAVEGRERKVYKVAKWTKEGWDKHLADFKPDPKPDPVEDSPPGEGEATDADPAADTEAGTDAGTDADAPEAGSASVDGESPSVPETSAGTADPDAGDEGASDESARAGSERG